MNKDSGENLAGGGGSEGVSDEMAVVARPDKYDVALKRFIRGEQTSLALAMIGIIGALATGAETGGGAPRTIATAAFAALAALSSLAEVSYRTAGTGYLSRSDWLYKVTKWLPGMRGIVEFADKTRFEQQTHETP